MNKDRGNLTEILTAIFISSNKNKNDKLREAMEDELSNKFPAGLISDVYTTRKQINGITNESQLYLITKFLYDSYDLFKDYTKELTKDKIDPTIWFTDNEIKKAKETENSAYSKDEEIWFELHNADYIEEYNVWISSHESYKNLVDNWNKGAILYNQETQREGVIKTILGEQITVPKLNHKNVNEISKAMMNHEFFTNMITLNIQETGLEKEYIEYYPADRLLRVKKSRDSQIFIVDGFHRLNSVIKVLTDHPNFQGYLCVRVTNLNTQKAQALIVQESKNSPIGEHTIKTFDVTNKYMQIAKKINEYESEATNSMYHKMTYIIDEVKSNSRYCLFSNIAYGLEDNFSDLIKEASPRDIDKITRFLVAFYNEFIGIFDTYFKNLKATKENMTIADINIFSGILLIARKLYKTKGWQDTLEDMLGNVNWARSEPVWKTMLTNSLSFNKPTKVKIYNFFDSLTENKAGVL